MKPILCHILFGNISKLPPLLNELEYYGSLHYCVHVVLPQYNNDSDYLATRFPEITFHFIPVRMRTVLASASPIAKLLRYFEFVFRTAFAAAAVPARLMVSHDATSIVPASIAAGWLGIPLLYRAHELFGETVKGTSPLLSLWKTLEKRYVKRVDAIIVPEKHRADIYVNEYGARTKPFIVRNIPPLKAAYQESQHLRLSLGLTSEDVIVLYQGLLTRSRCIEELVQAFQFLSGRYHLVLLGDIQDTFKKLLQNIIERHALANRIHFIPFAPYDKLSSITASADIGCLLYRNDCRNNVYAAPNKLYEYLFAGLPVIVSDSPSLTSLVFEKNAGISVDPENPNDIAKAVESAIALERGNLLAERMRALFRFEDEIEVLSNVYAQLLVKSGAS